MSTDPFVPIWRALIDIAREPNIPAFDGLAPPGLLPLPWQTWLLIGLFRHHRRQLWVGQIVTSRLGGNLDVLSTCGALGHPEGLPQSGLVPGMTDWEYYFHGRGCCLTRRSNGEAIDVDFHGGSAEYFDWFFYRGFLRSLRDPEAPEARLIALHPTWDALELDFRDLGETNALTAFEGSWPHRLSDEALRHADVVENFCRLWADPARRPGLAARIGDWGAARAEATAAGDAALEALAADRQAEEYHGRRERLIAAFGQAELSRLALAGLNDLAVEDMPRFLLEALRGTFSGTTSVALGIVRRGNDSVWCPEVWALLRRLNPSSQAPQPYLYNECLAFLAGHGYRRAELAAALSVAGGSGIGDAALLAMEHFPEVALTLFRRALRSVVPCDRATAAAILALIDRPWARRELLDVLSESDDQERTAETRAALMEVQDPEAHRAVRTWEQRNPRGPESGPWITMSEMIIRDRPVFLRYEMEKLHDRVMRVRDRAPPEPPAPHRPCLRLWRG
jgi:hypothetical protein